MEEACFEPSNCSLLEATGKTLAGFRHWASFELGPLVDRHPSRLLDK